jgi:hypothetical protein
MAQTHGRQIARCGCFLMIIVGGLLPIFVLIGVGIAQMAHK